MKKTINFIFFIVKSFIQAVKSNVQLPIIQVIFFEPIEKSRHSVYNKYNFYKELLYFKKTKKEEIMHEYTYTETKIAKIDRLSSKSRKKIIQIYYY